VANDGETQIDPHTLDKDYNLVSVLHQALQDSDNCAQYTRPRRRRLQPSD